MKGKSNLFKAFSRERGKVKARNDKAGEHGPGAKK